MNLHARHYPCVFTPIDAMHERFLREAPFEQEPISPHKNHASDPGLTGGTTGCGGAIARKPNPLPSHDQKHVGRFPSWLHRALPKGDHLFRTHDTVRQGTLRTVCEEAKCPNLVECYSKKTATFLLMGHQCTRRCGFCSIDHHASPPPLDPTEPQQIAHAVTDLGLRHAVLTQVARDDLEDGGASHLVRVIQAIRKNRPGCTVEVLTSDFEGKASSLKTVLDEEPEVFNHNLETVRRLTPRVRHQATYERTLAVLESAKKQAKGKTQFIKSGIMVGLGEEDQEVYETLGDLKACGVDIVTIGQYLQSTRHGLLVRRFVTPETFESYRLYGLSIGLKHIYSAPFVRSSYNAHLFVEGGIDA